MATTAKQGTRPRAAAMTEYSLWRPLRLLAIPALFYLLVFVVPFANLLRISLFKSVPGRFMERVVTGEAYKTLITDPYYLQVLLTTLKVGLLVTVLALLMGYPLAFFVSRTTRKWRGTLLALVVTPLLVSVVVRTYGWLVILNNNGLVNSVLLKLGIISQPLKLIFNQTGVVIGLTHVLMPFMVLSIASSLQNLDSALEDAAASLGASPWHTFWRVIWPLTLPGVAAGSVIVFILSVGSFVTPTLLGGSLVVTIPMLAYQRFQLNFDWPFGSALAMVLLLTVLVTVFLYNWVLQPWLTKGDRQA